MRGQKISVKIKRHKVVSVINLVKEGRGSISVAKACRRMRIKRRTYYEYKKLGPNNLKDKRFKEISDWQKMTLNILIKMHPSGSINSYVEALNSWVGADFFIGHKVEVVTRHKVWTYLKNGNGLKTRSDSSRMKREGNTIKSYGRMLDSHFDAEGSYWKFWKNIWVPKTKK